MVIQAKIPRSFFFLSLANNICKDKCVLIFLRTLFFFLASD